MEPATERKYKKPYLVEYSHSIEALANRYNIPAERFKDYLFGKNEFCNFENLKNGK